MSTKHRSVSTAAVAITVVAIAFISVVDTRDLRDTKNHGGSSQVFSLSNLFPFGGINTQPPRLSLPNIGNKLNFNHGNDGGVLNFKPKVEQKHQNNPQPSKTDSNHDRGSDGENFVNKPTLAKPSDDHKQQQQQQPSTSTNVVQNQPKPTSNGHNNYDHNRIGSNAGTNASTVTTAVTEKAKLETTTQDRSIITAPLKSCPEGQRMGPDRNCRPNFTDPEEERRR